MAILAAGYLRNIQRQREAIESQVRERTRELHEALLSLEKLNHQLEESESRFRNLVEHMPQGVVVECHEKVVVANRVAVEMLGFDPLQADHPYSLLDFTPESDRAQATELLRHLRENTHELPSFDMKLIRRDSSLLDVEICIASCKTPAGAHSIQVVMRDISQRKQEEAENARLMQAIEQAAESIVMTDAMANVVYVNPAFERISGYTRAEVMGKNPRILKSGRHNAEAYAAMWKQLVSGESWIGRFVNRRKDGRTYVEEATISPVVDREGRIVNYVAVKRDVSVETELQEKLYQSQKMEAIGRLAGGVAHDFNNMLMVINSYTELMAAGLDDGDERRRYTEKILRATERSAGLTRQLLAFGRRQTGNPVVLDCNAVLSEMSGMVRRLIAENIELKCKLSPGLWRVKADPDQLVQVILNLCVNSRDAMPQGGLLTLSSRNDDEGPGFVEIAVADTGIGIPYDAREKIFEPFYTTKPAGKGTGLGLSIVYGIVQQLGGSLRVESEPGKGATFRVFLPSCSEFPAGEAQVAAVSMPPGACLVLLVEDEEALRLAIAEQLRRNGYYVLCAANGEEAMAEIAQHPEIAILVTDLVMPRMGGRELAREASLRLPALRIMVLSGYDEEHLTPLECNGRPTVFLQKPFTLTAMIEQLSQLSSAPEA